MPSDRQLLLKMHKGHEGAARELWSAHAPRMRSYAGSIVGSAADDVVQSVFVAIIRQPRRVIREVSDPGAWLMVLTRREALNQLRASRRDAARRLAAPTRRSTAAASGSPEQESLHRAMEGLPRRLREVVVLRHVAGLTFDQVAVALGANRNTAAARYREAIRRLRLMLEGSDVLVGSAS